MALWLYHDGTFTRKHLQAYLGTHPDERVSENDKNFLGST
jgi:hypothetical protein